MPITYDNEAVTSPITELAEQLAIAPVDEITTIYASGKPAEVTTEGKVGRKVNNVATILGGILGSLTAGKSYNGSFTFDELPFGKQTATVNDLKPARLYTYDVDTWGTVRADFDEFLSQAATTLADSKGWVRGNVSFKRVASGGNFTLVLAEPARVDAAASICSATYSCQVGRYVIINDERWRKATPSWNNDGGSLRDYRHMLINHEVGHQIGLGHRSCGGAGQKAPVMQQQSIDLQGCRFNPWPLESEIDAL